MGTSARLQVGGPLGAFLSPDELDVEVSFASLTARGQRSVTAVWWRSTSA